MTNFTATGDWTAQGNVAGVVTFSPSTGGSVVTATIVNGTFSVAVPVITGSYLVSFSQITLNGKVGTIAPFDFNSPQTAVTLPINTIVGPAPTVVVSGPAPAAVFVPSYIGWATPTEVSVANTTTSTQLVQLTVGTGQLQAGSAFRFVVRGTVQTTSTSGTLTFTPQIGATAASQTYQMATQTSAAGPVPFFLEINAVVRSAGSSGLYITHGYGRVEFTTPALLATTNATAAALDTTQATTVLQLNAAWATANAANILLVESAIIERLA